MSRSVMLAFRGKGTDMIWTLVTVGFVLAAVGLGALYTVAVVGSAEEHSAHRDLAVDEIGD